MYGTREEAPADYLYAGFQTEIHFKPRVSPQARLCPGRLPTSRATREAPHKQNYDQGAHPQPELRPGSWLLLAGWLAELASWLAGWLWVWLAGLLRPRKAERGPERRREAQRSGAWIEQACHALGCDAGGSPPADLRPERLATEFLCNPRGSPHVLCTTMYVCMYVEFQQEIHFKTSVSQQAELCLYVCTTRQVSHKENSDQGGSPQPKLRPGSLPTSRITTRELAGWLVG